ncbi:unnamed protein product [Diamesa serratosioi]
MWDSWSNSDNSLNRRASEVLEAKAKVQLHHHKTQHEIFDLIRIAINDKSNPLKVAQTRLKALTRRPDLKLCRDNAHVRLVDEVKFKIPLQLYIVNYKMLSHGTSSYLGQSRILKET